MVLPAAVADLVDAAACDPRCAGDSENRDADRQGMADRGTEALGARLRVLGHVASRLCGGPGRPGRIGREAVGG